MLQMLYQFVTGIGLLAGVAGVGAAFTFGVATVCQWLKWAPINVKVTNVSVRKEIEDVGRDDHTDQG